VGQLVIPVKGGVAGQLVIPVKGGVGQLVIPVKGWVGHNKPFNEVLIDDAHREPILTYFDGLKDSTVSELLDDHLTDKRTGRLINTIQNCKQHVLKTGTNIVKY
jgi:hypothetical protein